jgi:uncharacterized protein Yka (UPF0111/DUF47 family)
MVWRDVWGLRADPCSSGLTAQAAVMAEMALLLQRAVEGHGDEADQLAGAAASLEHEGDRLRQQLVTHLLDALVTPFDREDVNGLSRALDDITDYAESTIKALRLYRIAPDATIAAMVATLAEAATALREAVTTLVSDRRLSHRWAATAKRLENRMEALYRQAIADLTQSDDVSYIIRLREVYRHFSKSADRIDHAANVIIDIVVKEGR